MRQPAEQRLTGASSGRYRGLRVIAEIQLHDRKLHQLKDKV